MERWVRRVALVTGASSGIGYAVAKTLAEKGMKVVGCSRNIDKIQELAENISASNAKGSVSAIKCDIRNEEEILHMFKVIKEQHGGVDICVNSAGAGFDAPLLSGKTEDWRAMLEIDVLGVCICTREAVKSMQERNVDDGHVIHINSLGGHRVLKNSALSFHAATKFALTALTEGLRNELRASNSHIRVSQVSPGVVQTEFLGRLYGSTERAEDIYATLTCLKPEDIADSLVYMISAPPHVQVHDILIRPVEQIT